MTKKEMFNAIATVITNTNVENKAEMLEFIAHEVELLSKKGSQNSKAKAESDARAEKLYIELCRMDEPVTFAELKARAFDEEVKDWTPQRMSALVRKLGDKVKKEMRGKSAYFYVA